MTDSSPQADFDWLWAIYDEVSNEDLVIVLKAAIFLERHMANLPLPKADLKSKELSVRQAAMKKLVVVSPEVISPAQCL